MVNPLENRSTSPPARSSSSNLPTLQADRGRESPHAQPATKGFRPATISRVGRALLLLGVVVACSSESWADDPPGKAASANGAATPAPTAADSLKALDAGIQSLTTRLRTLQARLAARVKPDASPDLSALRSRIDDLAGTTEAVAPLVKSAGALEERVGAVDKQVADLRAQIVALKARTERTATTGRGKESSEGDIANAVEMFKASRYKEASTLFRTLTQSRPDDARVWYYAGLSNGLATNDWAGETLRLVNKGVEREKAGTPDKAKIDASLANVTEPSVKKWVDYFRRAARR